MSSQVDSETFIEYQTLMPTQEYRLPDLLALVSKPAIGHLNPHLDQADSDFNIWVQKTLGSKFAEEIYKAQVPYLSAATSPHASYKELRVGTEVILSTFILEVLTDDRSSVEAKAISDAWMNIFRGSEHGGGFDHPLLQILRKEIVPSVKTSLEPLFWSQLVAACEEYTSNVVNEALDREAYANNTQICDVDAYLEMRRGAAALRAFFTIGRAFQKAYVPDEVLAHPVIREMEDASADMSVLTNDIYSYKKEHGHLEGLNNVLTVLQNDPKTVRLSLQERFDFTGKLWTDAFGRFEAARRKLPSFGEEVDKHVATYVDVLHEINVGVIEWSISVPRYHVFDSESDRKNNILRLSVDESETVEV